MANNASLSNAIYDELVKRIRQGDFADGKRLPTEKELAAEFYVSRITPKRALDRLAEEGIITRIPGRGSFLIENSPLPIASQKVGDEKKIIALIMGGYSSHFGNDILIGAMDASQQQGLHLVIKSTYGNHQQETEIIQSLLSSGVSGIIVQPVQGEIYNPLIVQLILDGFPIVLLDRKLQGIAAPFVGVDNIALGKEAGQRIIAQGHRNIALLAMTNQYSSTISDRIQGFSEACQDSALPSDKKLWLTNISQMIHSCKPLLSVEEEYEIMVQLLQQHLLKNPEITAILATEYRVAKAACEAVMRLGKSIPKDISIVGFDNDPGCIQTHAMSHVEQPQVEMGRTACEVLKQRLSTSEAAPTQHLLPGQWIQGSSLGPVPNLCEGSPSNELSR